VLFLVLERWIEELFLWLFRCTVALRCWVLLRCEEERTAERSFWVLVLTAAEFLLVLLVAEVLLTAFVRSLFVETVDLVLVAVFVLRCTFCLELIAPDLLLVRFPSTTVLDLAVRA
jgi:hypothetical protein